MRFHSIPIVVFVLNYCATETVGDHAFGCSVVEMVITAV